MAQRSPYDVILSAAKACREPAEEDLLFLPLSQAADRCLGRKFAVVLAVSVCLLASLMARAQTRGNQPEPWMESPPTQTGPAVGQKIPSFRAPDQFGKMQDFNSLRGPNGAAIFFNRSADW